MMKRVLIMVFTVFFFLIALGYSYIYNNSTSKVIYAQAMKNGDYDLFFPDVSSRTTPEDLLVIVFLYDDYPNSNERIDNFSKMTDEEIEIKYNQEIFGSGNIEQQTWGVNDFYKENSNNQFYFNPILIGDNTSGVYPIRLHKEYNMNEFSSDIEIGFKTLTDQGFDLNGFESSVNTGISQRKHVVCIFPRIAIAHVGTYRLNEDVYSSVAIVDYESVLSTTTHELGHMLEMPDLYNQGGQASLMGETTLNSTIPDLRYLGAPNNYTIPSHIDPLHKIALGWYDYEIIDKNSSVTLYPTTSSLYNIVVVPTLDKNQYYIIENRKANSFETQITDYASRGDIDDPEDAGYSNYEGVNIWRVDKLGYENIDKTIPSNRNGDFIIGVLKNPNDFFVPKKYLNTSDVSSNLKENTNIKIEYIKENLDGSVDINISFDDKYSNSYVIRYNANDGTNRYIDYSYTYYQIVNFPMDLFSREGYRIIGWSKNEDGSGTIYYDDIISGLSEENESIVNLYAQWSQNTYTIKFDLNGADGTMADVTNVSGIYTLPECAVNNNNNEFIGWLYEKQIFLPGDQINIDKNIELIAQWKYKDTFQINFMDGDSIIDSQTISRGNTIVEPMVPIKDGYVFGGWYRDSNCKNKWFFQQQVYDDLSLYAKWIPNEKIIRNIDVEVPMPKIGEAITINKQNEEWDWTSQNPMLDIELPIEVNYKLFFEDDDNSTYMNWVDNFDEEMNPFIGTIDYDTNYYVRIRFITDDDYYFDENMEILVNNKSVDKIFYISDHYLEIGVILNISKNSNIDVYQILEGSNQLYNKSNGNDLILKASGDISKFKGVKIDGTLIEESNYIVESGSTILTLKNDYLNTLSVGQHIITFVYEDGTVDTTINVEYVTNSNDNENIKSNSNIPKTGDNIVTYIYILILGFGILTGGLFYFKKLFESE